MAVGEPCHEHLEVNIFSSLSSFVVVCFVKEKIVFKLSLIYTAAIIHSLAFKVRERLKIVDGMEKKNRILTAPQHIPRV